MNTSGTENKNGLLPLFLVSCLVILPYLIFLFFWPYMVAGGDEARQIDAAVQMIKGLGYVSSTDIMPLDLTVQNYAYLFHWPIGYSFVVWCFLKLGMSPSLAGATTQALTVIGSFFCWSICVNYLIQKRWLQFLFLGFLGAHFFSWGNYNTAAFSWGLNGLLTWWLVRWMISGEPKQDWKFISISGIIISLLVLFRFQNATFIMAICFFYLLNRLKKEPFTKLLRNLFFLGAIPAFTFWLILYTNQIWGSNFGRGDLRTLGLHTELYWMLPKWVSGLLLGGSFRLDEIFPFLRDPSWKSFAVELLCIGFFVGAWIWIQKNRQILKPYLTFQWFLILYGITYGMLCVIAFGYNYNQTYDHTRYFFFLIPPFAISILSLFDSKTKIRNGSLIALAFVIFGMLVATGFSAHRRKLNFDNEQKAAAVLPKIDEIIKKYPDYSYLIAVDTMFPNLVLGKYSNLVSESAAILQEKNHFSKPTILFVIHDRKPVKAMYDSLKKLDQVLARYKPNKEELPVEIDFYWQVFQPGPAPAL